MSRSRQQFWPLRNDPWLDNGLERWARLLEHVSQQHPGLIQIEWHSEGLMVSMMGDDVNALVSMLNDALKQQIMPNLYSIQKTSQGEQKKRLLGFIGFNQQPPNQWPQLYSDQRRREELLRAVFQEDVSVSRTCPLCSSPIGRAPPNLTLSVYPLVTKNKAFSGARTRWAGSGFEGRPTNVSVCPRCYLLGALTWADDALLYLCGMGRDRNNKLAVVILPAPPEPDLITLHRQKEEYRERLRHERGPRSNVYFRPPHAEYTGKQAEEGEQEGKKTPVREGRFSLLLAFLEQTLHEVAQKSYGQPFQMDVIRRQIPNGWLFISIPQGRMKNVNVHDLLLDDPTLQLLARLVEADVQPYAQIMAQLALQDDEGKPLPDEQLEMREAMAQGLLTNSFATFARAFLPRPRQRLRLYGSSENHIFTLVKEWRWKGMEEQIETIRKAAYALARIAASRRQPVILYQLERVRTRKDLLSVLQQATHRLIGMDAQDMRYIPINDIEDLVQLVCKDTVPFEDLKNTIFVFAGVEYARKVRAKEKSSQGGESDA